MNIGFDLDKVFVNYPPLIPDWIIDRLYKKRSNGVLLYRIPGKLEQKIRYLSHYPILRPIIKNNLTAVKKMNQKNEDKLFLISSRYNFLRQRTEEIISHNRFQQIFKDMAFNFSNKQPHIFKSNMIQKFHIQRFLDDDLPLLQYLSKKHPSVLFFWLNKQRNDKLKENLYAVSDISSVFQKI